MIIVKIELHSAVTKRATLLGAAIIANDGCSKDGRRGNYNVRVGRKDDAHDTQAIWSRPLRTARVENYPRLSYNVWRLVLRAIAAAFPEEKVTLPDCDVQDMQTPAEAS